MKLQDILTSDCTLCAVQSTSKKRILEKICAVAAARINELSEQELLESLMNREKIGSTGIGNGIAIPHGRISNDCKVVAVVATSATAIDFDAIDNRPVDVFVALFVPSESCKQHLTTLQSIAQLFSDKQTLRQVRKCQSDAELFELIQQLS